MSREEAQMKSGVERGRAAFSLVELSIVLVILGLLAGGVLSGKALMRAAELRAVGEEYGRFYTAIETFHDKYNALPGDLPNATSYWGAADGSTGVSKACYYAVSGDKKTCNGNGNGEINIYDEKTSNEAYRMWQHLANAGLIEGHYTGAPDQNPVQITVGKDFKRYAVAGVNVPKSKLPNAGWYSEFSGSNAPGNGNWWPGDYGNPLFFGGMEADDLPEIANLKPEEAWNIDKKLDDGKPASGKVINPLATMDCTTTHDTNKPEQAEYAVSRTDNVCRLYFLTAF